MEATDRQCACGRPVASIIAPPVEVAMGDLGMRLEGVPAWRCEAGHVEVADAALADLVVAVADERVLVADRPRLRRDDRCGDCGAALVLPGRRTEVPLPLAAPSGVVTPVLLATFTRCPDCGRAQVDAATRTALPTLVQAALAELAHLPPNG